MNSLGAQDSRSSASRAEPALLLLGFRPFFLLAASFAVLQLVFWLGVYTSGYQLITYYDRAAVWHGHEMIFGYAVAVIAGFLLTAVPNWTGLSTPTGKPLAALATLWVAGRILPFFPDSAPPWFIAIVDIAFLPVLIGVLAIPLLQARQPRNLVFLLLLGALMLANVLIHLDILGGVARTARPGMYLAVNLILLLIVIIGGRVIPFFAERALPGLKTRRWPAVEAVAFGSLMLLMVAELAWSHPLVIGVLGMVAALSHGARLSGWYSQRIWSVPLLWVLYLGYGWLVLGMALKALPMLGITTLVPLHALTVGCIGVLTLGMMARVALGHTGRVLRAAKPVVVAFVLINVAALARGFLPIAFPSWYLQWVAASGVLWILAFSIFTYWYAPILLAPRLDAR